MILAISGKIGSGKDTIGQIIQYLSTVDNPTKEEFIRRHIKSNDALVQPAFEIKKFAYKLKQITALLLGVSVNQLEDRDFKEKELGEEWWYWSVYDGIEYKPQYFPTRQEAEKRCLEVWGDDFESYITLVKLTPRKILQLLGTEAGRQIIHPNIWVNALMSEYVPNTDKLNEALSYHYLSETYPTKVDSRAMKDAKEVSIQESKWIITDMRFPNELDAVKKRGGITIRVNRMSDEAGQYEVKQHPSETALDNHKFDYVIDNSGSISDLINKVREVLIKEGII